jgi:predicted RNA-binding protein Jag
MDLQFSEHIESEAKKFSDYVESEGKKLELIRETIHLKIDKREQKILLEKHDWKYNVLIYGLKEEKDEKINEQIYDFMVNDLNIEKKRADSYT